MSLPHEVLFTTAYNQLSSLIVKVEPSLLPCAQPQPFPFALQKGFYYKFDRHAVHTAVNNAFIKLFESSGYTGKLEQLQQYRNVAGRVDAVAVNDFNVCSFEFDTGIHIKKKSVEKVINLYTKLPSDKNYYGFLCVRGSAEFDKKCFAETIRRINSLRPPADINLYIIYLSSNYITKYKP